MKKCCETCENLIAIGEGDHICLESRRGWGSGYCCDFGLFAHG